MSKTKLKDAEAKRILLRWPMRTKRLWPTPSHMGFWLRAQPRKGRMSGPVLKSPGAALFSTQPDGMWIYLDERNFADAVCLEVCGSVQNLNDKRSRYMPASHSLVLTVSQRWLREGIRVQRGGTQPRWIACRTIKTTPQRDLEVPVRFLRVLFVIPNRIYRKWVPNHAPTGWEYYCPHSALGGFTSQKMQIFLRQMAPTSHLYSK